MIWINWWLVNNLADFAAQSDCKRRCWCCDHFSVFSPVVSNKFGVFILIFLLLLYLYFCKMEIIFWQLHFKVKVLKIQLFVSVWSCNSEVETWVENIKSFCLLHFKSSQFLSVCSCVCMRVCVALLQILFSLLSNSIEWINPFSLSNEDQLMLGSCRQIWLRGKSLGAGQGSCRCKSDLLILCLRPERM